MSRNRFNINFFSILISTSRISSSFSLLALTIKGVVCKPISCPSFLALLRKNIMPKYYKNPKPTHIVIGMLYFVRTRKFSNECVENLHPI